jgi:NNP family nitrate/nitrite transporter-like MFS transporter
VLARPVGGWPAARIGSRRVLQISFVTTIAPGVVLAGTYKDIVPLTICCLTIALALGLGSGAVFKLVATWFPAEVGAVSGVVGAAGGLGGFFPPLVMALVKSLTGSYALGFILFAAVAVLCLVVLSWLDRAGSQSNAGAGTRRCQVSSSG